MPHFSRNLGAFWGVLSVFRGFPTFAGFSRVLGKSWTVWPTGLTSSRGSSTVCGASANGLAQPYFSRSSRGCLTVSLVLVPSPVLYFNAVRRWYPRPRGRQVQRVSIPVFVTATPVYHGLPTTGPPARQVSSPPARRSNPTFVQTVSLALDTIPGWTRKNRSKSAGY